MGQPISACDLLGFGLSFSSCLVFFHSSPTLLGATGAHLLLMTVGSAPRNFIGYSMDDCKFFSVLLRCGFVHPPVPRYTSHPFPIHSSILYTHYVPSPHHPIMSSSCSKPSKTSRMISKKRKEQRTCGVLPNTRRHGPVFCATAGKFVTQLLVQVRMSTSRS